MSPEFPWCAICRVKIEPGVNFVFRVDGRVKHVECPPVPCAECGGTIKSDTPIRRDGERLLHAHCWVRRYRAAAQKSSRRVAS